MAGPLTLRSLVGPPALAHQIKEWARAIPKSKASRSNADSRHLESPIDQVRSRYSSAPTRSFDAVTERSGREGDSRPPAFHQKIRLWFRNPAIGRRASSRDPRALSKRGARLLSSSSRLDGRQDGRSAGRRKRLARASSRRLRCKRSAQMRSAKTFRSAIWPKRPKQTTSLWYAWVVPLRPPRQPGRPPRRPAVSQAASIGGAASRPGPGTVVVAPGPVPVGPCMTLPSGAIPASFATKSAISSGRGAKRHIFEM